MKGRTALLVVDVQEAAVSPDLHAGDVVLGNISSLVEACRDSGVDIVFVQHDGDPGSDYEPESPGWRIHGSLEPRPGERVVRKRTNSAFRDTDLHEHLVGRDVGTLIIVGLHTEYCVDTTLRVAFELGYGIVVPELTNTTLPNGSLTAEDIYRHHNDQIFRDRFAEVHSLEATLGMLPDLGMPPDRGSEPSADVGRSRDRGDVLRTTAQVRRKSPSLPRFVTVPDFILSGWGLDGTTVVTVSLDGSDIGRRSLKRWGSGRPRWFFDLTEAQCRAAGVDAGDRVRVEIRRASTELAQELRDLIESNAIASERWNALSKARQRAIAEHVREAKRPETRSRRAGRALLEKSGSG